MNRYSNQNVVQIILNKVSISDLFMNATILHQFHSLDSESVAFLWNTWSAKNPKKIPSFMLFVLFFFCFICFILLLFFWQNHAVSDLYFYDFFSARGKMNTSLNCCFEIGG